MIVPMRKVHIAACRSDHGHRKEHDADRDRVLGDDPARQELIVGDDPVEVLGLLPVDRHA